MKQKKKMDGDKAGFYVLTLLSDENRLTSRQASPREPIYMIVAVMTFDKLKEWHGSRFNYCGDKCSCLSGLDYVLKK